jgi:outer membrane immunogenic protein
MHKLAATATVAALSLVSTAAGAADWSGFYVTGHVDAAWGKADWAGFDGAEGGGEGAVEAARLPAPVGYLNTTLFHDDEKDTGWGGGVGFGYNFQFDNVVLGAVVDWTWLDVGDSRSFTGCCGTNHASSDLSNIGTLRGILGVAMEDKVMPYVTAGWAWGDVNHQFRSAAGFGHRINLDASDGWTAGGGINVAIGENTALNLEVLYVDFGDASGHRSDTWPSEAAASVESHATIARIGVIFRL